MKIAFWSPFHGVGTTAAMIAAAAAFEWKMKMSCLLMRSGPCENDLESCLLRTNGASSDDLARELGVDELARRFTLKKLTGSDVYICSSQISDRSAILAGPSAITVGTEKDGVFTDILKRVMNAAGERHDLVLIDTEPGYSERSLAVLKNCDIVAAVLRQGRKMTQTKGRLLEDHIDEDRLFYVFGMYNRESRYTLRNMRTLIPGIKRNNSGAVPINAGFSDSLDEGNAFRFLRNLFDDEDNESAPKFVKDITDIAGKMIRIAQRRQE